MQCWPSHRHRDTNRVGTTSIALGVLFCNTLDAPCMTSYQLYSYGIYIYTHPVQHGAVEPGDVPKTSSTASEHDVSPASWLGILELAKRHLQTMSGDAMGISHNFHTISINWCKLRHVKACDLGVFWDSWIPNSICFLVYFLVVHYRKVLGMTLFSVKSL